MLALLCWGFGCPSLFGVSVADPNQLWRQAELPDLLQKLQPLPFGNGVYVVRHFRSLEILVSRHRDASTANMGLRSLVTEGPVGGPAICMQAPYFVLINCPVEFADFWITPFLELQLLSKKSQLFGFSGPLEITWSHAVFVFMVLMYIFETSPYLIQVNTMTLFGCGAARNVLWTKSTTTDVPLEKDSWHFQVNCSFRLKLQHCNDYLFQWL